MVCDCHFDRGKRSFAESVRLAKTQEDAAWESLQNKLNQHNIGDTMSHDQYENTDSRRMTTDAILFQKQQGAVGRLHYEDTIAYINARHTAMEHAWQLAERKVINSAVDKWQKEWLQEYDNDALAVEKYPVEPYLDQPDTE